MSNDDRVRFIHNLYEFNKSIAANNTTRNLKRASPFPMNDLVGRSLGKLVDIHGWVLMRNHYHLLMSEHTEGGLSKFLMKLNVGYAKYFNEKYKRSGTLFQGRTKKIHIANDAHFLHILHYIHLNPLDFLKDTKDWRERHISGAARALKHLNTYRWSSYRDYCGIKNFPSILTTELFSDVFGNYKKTLEKYLRDLDIDPIRESLLE